jgi:hypothetical protein
LHCEKKKKETGSKNSFKKIVFFAFRYFNFKHTANHIHHITSLKQYHSIPSTGPELKTEEGSSTTPKPQHTQVLIAFYMIPNRVIAATPPTMTTLFIIITIMVDAPEGAVGAGAPPATGGVVSAGHVGAMVGNTGTVGLGLVSLAACLVVLLVPFMLVLVLLSISAITGALVGRAPPKTRNRSVSHCCVEAVRYSILHPSAS